VEDGGSIKENGLSERLQGIVIMGEAGGVKARGLEKKNMGFQLQCLVSGASCVWRGC